MKQDWYDRVLLQALQRYYYSDDHAFRTAVGPLPYCPFIAAVPFLPPPLSASVSLVPV